MKHHQDILFFTSCTWTVWAFQAEEIDAPVAPLVTDATANRTMPPVEGPDTIIRVESFE